MLRKTAHACGLLLGCCLALPQLATANLAGEADLSFYLPQGADYQAGIPTPAEVIGHEVGERHISHDRLVGYMFALDEASDRVRLSVTGETYERRPLLLLEISSARNIERIESLRRAHLDYIRGDADDPGLAVVALGYSIHGNEASGSNAAMLVAYHLAASRDPAVQRMLDETVILLDPSLNPDGLSRFAQWVNSHVGAVPVPDPATRELNEVWPGGRTNHYWFDLNRDWLPAQHPESRARLAWFHAWRPHVFADFHEMGTDRTYFFQPGVPTRNNPLTPPENIELTEALAEFHARAFDRNRVLYYSSEGYDDFYYGKGSTYPDIHGSVGLLFEQASARGHLQASVNGDLGLPYAIRNQFLTSMSTLEGAHALRQRLAAFARSSRDSALEAARKDTRGGFLFADPGDSARTAEFLDLLGTHQVEVYRAGRGRQLAGRAYAADMLYLVPVDQPQYRLVRTLFETPTSFRDNTFYDVSAWTMPMAFGLPFEPVSRRDARSLRAARVETAGPAGSSAPADSPYAWIVDWRDYYAGRVVNQAQLAGARARVATRAFTLRGETYPAGSVVLPTGLMSAREREAVATVLTDGSRHGVRVSSVETGFTASGTDLGSPSMAALERPRPAMLVGRGVNSYEAGEVWHLLDQRFGIGVTLLDRDWFERTELSDYTHLIMVHGRYDWIGDKAAAAIADWVRQGGILITQRGAAGWASSQAALLGNAEDKDEKAAPDEEAGDAVPAQQAYEGRDDWEARKVIGGAIFKTRLDVSHPLGFGFNSEAVPVFHRGTEWIPAATNPFENVAVYAESPLAAGYASEDNIEAMRKSVSVRQTRLGSGSVILFSDVPAFRAFWFGTSRLWLNALFFGAVVERVEP